VLRWQGPLCDVEMEWQEMLEIWVAGTNGRAPQPIKSPKPQRQQRIPLLEPKKLKKKKKAIVRVCVAADLIC
jgi:hypothetical protein